MELCVLSSQTGAYLFRCYCAGRISLERVICRDNLMV